MKFNLFLFIPLYLITVNIHGRRVRRVSNSQEEELERAHRNAICCQKKMRCCVKDSPPQIEIRAILTRCPSINDAVRGPTRNFNTPIAIDSVNKIQSFQGFDNDEPLLSSRVTKCKKKILFTLKMHYHGDSACKQQYVVVDHVYDSVSRKSVRLLNPYVIKLIQEPVSKSYELKFTDYVNAEAEEHIFNKHDSNYTGCYLSGMHPTCGLVKYDGKTIPFSSGFCCSCDAKTNQNRQPDSVNDKNEAIISYSDPSYLLDHIHCPRNYYNEFDYAKEEHDKGAKLEKEKAHLKPAITKGDDVPVQIKEGKLAQKNSLKDSKEAAKEAAKEKDEEHKMLRKRDDIENYLPEHVRSYWNHINDKMGNTVFAQRLLRKIRQTFPSGMQIRGGQNCATRFTPKGLNHEHYQESTHCLRFSELWYGIYRLGRSNVDHRIALNVYERFETDEGLSRWREITNGTVHMGNNNPLYEDEIPTVSIAFSSRTIADKHNYTKLRDKRILIPEGINDCDISKHPELRNGPEEFLVVKPSQIAIEGDQCDKVGVGFEAFFKQPSRCSVPQGTCLRNQPVDLWKHDRAKERESKKGCYFLKYHANLTKYPISYNETTGEKSLQVIYMGAHITSIDIEIKADFNAIIRVQTIAVITEVYVDSTCDKVTIMTIKVTNSGLVSSKYLVQLSDFPLDVSEDFGVIKSKQILIPPQNQHIFTLEVRVKLPADMMFCTVEVHNSNKELVALRRIRIQKYDRCICTWHCLCACIASGDGLKCNPMSLDHYHAAGFQGSLPMTTYVVKFSLLDDLLSEVFYFAIFLLALLLLLGICKALLGLCFLAVGMWGLAVILDLPKQIKKYYEPHLKNEAVVYDKDGFPIDPKTKARVRCISIATQFCMNVVFFFIYPLACCMLILKRLCCPHYTQSDKKKQPVKKSSSKDSKGSKGSKDSKGSKESKGSKASSGGSSTKSKQSSKSNQSKESPKKTDKKKQDDKNKSKPKPKPKPAKDKKKHETAYTVIKPSSTFPNQYNKDKHSEASGKGKHPSVCHCKAKACSSKNVNTSTAEPEIKKKDIKKPSATKKPAKSNEKKKPGIVNSKTSKSTASSKSRSGSRTRTTGSVSRSGSTSSIKTGSYSSAGQTSTTHTTTDQSNALRTQTYIVAEVAVENPLKAKSTRSLFLSTRPKSM